MIEIKSAQDSLNFVEQQLANIEKTMYRRKYAPIVYAEIVPISTEVPSWATEHVYYSLDAVGMAKFIEAGAYDIPMVNIDGARTTIPLYRGGIGYGWDIDEIQRAAKTGIALNQEYADAAREAYERHAQDVCLNGDAKRGINGFLNHPNVPVANVPNGAGGNEEWSTKTADEILDDINDMINDQYVTTKQNELISTILLPINAFNILVNKRLSTGDTTVTLMEFIKTNSIYTAITNKPLTIKALAALATAGAAGEGRMVGYHPDAGKVKFHIPEPLNFLAPQPKGLGVEIPGTYKLGGVQATYPLSISYRDRVQ